MEEIVHGQVKVLLQVLKGDICVFTVWLQLQIVIAREDKTQREVLYAHSRFSLQVCKGSLFLVKICKHSLVDLLPFVC